MSQQIYQLVTDRVLAFLEQGVVPWKKPWKTSGLSALPPSNFVSRRPYRGINLFLLIAQPFGSPYWLTFKQAQERGGHVRRRERGTPIVFWRIDQRTEDLDEEASATEYRRVLLRYYTVFNLEQCQGIDVPEAQPAEGGLEFDPIPACEAVYGNMPDPPELCHGGERAYYRRSMDLVQLPRREAFSQPERYYSTQFHELAHSTGHPSRLNRFAEEDNPGIFGSPAYAREEFVAEMTAAMMSGALGISPVKVEAISPDGGEELLESSAAYLRHWMDVLKADSRAVVIAAARAQKAADYILGRQGQAEIPEHAEAA